MIGSNPLHWRSDTWQG